MHYACTCQTLMSAESKVGGTSPRDEDALADGLGFHKARTCEDERVIEPGDSLG